MNKIPIKKTNVTQKRSHIIYHYKPKRTSGQPSKQKISIVKPKKELKTERQRVQRNVATKEQQLKLRPVNVKSRLMPKQSRSTKCNFDVDKSKIRSLKGVGSGKFLAVFAPGPSILEAEIEKLIGIKRLDTMTINKPDNRFWPTDYWMFCDRTQYDRNKDAFNSYRKIVINTTSIKASHPNQIRIKNLPNRGFSTDMVKGFHIGRSTTFSAMQVAAYMGYDKIFIFGCDMVRVEIEKDGTKRSLLHSYGQNKDVPEEVRLARFPKEAEFYDAASKIMSEDLRSRYYFCSEYNPWPFIKRFNRLNQKEAVDFIIKEVNDA